jgi:hypothetical protein
MPRIRLLSPLPVQLSTKRGSTCTIAFEIQEPHGKHAITLRESGRVGWWELHMFGAWEHRCVDELLYRSGVAFNRGMAARVATRLVESGMAEVVAASDSSSDPGNWEGCRPKANTPSTEPLLLRFQRCCDLRRCPPPFSDLSP